MFAVVMQGAYRHSIYGPFDYIEQARIVAERKAGEESDGYHDFQIVELKGVERDVVVEVYTTRVQSWERDHARVEMINKLTVPNARHTWHQVILRYSPR